MSDTCNRSGDAAASLIALIPELERVVRCLTRDRGLAEDIAQEALMRVWARLDAGAEIGDLRPYLMTAARNLVRRGPAGAREVAMSDLPEPVAPSTLPARLALMEVAGAIARLPRGEARLVLRHAVAGESYARIAEAEGVPIGTVMSRLARGRARLRAGCGLPASGPATARLTGGAAA